MQIVDTAKKLQQALTQRFNDPNYISLEEMQSCLEKAISQAAQKLVSLCLKEKIISKKEAPEISNASSVLNVLYPLINVTLKLTDDHWQLFHDEFINSIENTALFLVYRHKWCSELAQSIKSLGHDNFWNWLEASKNKFDYLAFLEQWGSIGHPLHPTPKNRMGLSYEESLKYSPDFQACYNIFFLALHKDCSHHESLTSQEDINTIFEKHFPAVYANWRFQLQQQKLDPQHYWLLPCHPWQFKNVLPQKFSRLISENKLLLFDTVSLTVLPTLSFRTLIPRLPTPKPHLKVPIGIRITSVARTISPGTCRMSPRVGNLLQRIFEKENHFSKSIYHCIDRIGVHVQSIPDHYDDDQRHLSTLIRQNPLTLSSENETIIPLTCLFSPSPLSELPILIEVMHTQKIFSPQKAFDYFKRHVALTLNAFLDLYLMYGIALEAHTQNTLIVFKEGCPTRFINRDLGGIYIHMPTLQQQDFTLLQDAPTLILTSDPKVARYKILHTVYQTHLTSLISCLHLHYGIEPQALWHGVARLTHERFVQTKPHVSFMRWEEEYQGLFQDNWPLKALTRMRLLNKREDIYIDSSENPLRSC
ncbi:siderophore biosynthesis protein, IucA/IucC family [Coxiella burnetii]|uniref:Siderophore synthase n=1 Tax=Coxiella burnetii (strain Dugway 5J108-111) TaxID=434922 RepID=A9KEH0_COXBN|nr:IucA/IucC family protein [Coxiella burnetii]ABS78424.1 siderophore synthase [Coxiella burnetii Dugway 5J108-111]OYK79942.1 siderophore biosynthesis protein, IucA/IucC family [Coxiella burnetii]OYK82024.1 siderophore biosynthesis protein, IucA/IucC family [Coxiella burnetii]